MKVSLELLYHFQCGCCNKWWSIGDYGYHAGNQMTCPYCNVGQVLPEKPLLGKDFDLNVTPVWEKVARISSQVPDEEWEKLPTDLSKKFDDYQVLPEKPVVGSVLPTLYGDLNDSPEFFTPHDPDKPIKIISRRDSASQSQEST